MRPQQPPRASASSAFDFAGPLSRHPDSSNSNSDGSGAPSSQGRKTPRRAAAQAGVLAAATGAGGAGAAGGATSSASAVPAWLPSHAPSQMRATWGFALPSYELMRRYFAAKQAGLGDTEAAAEAARRSRARPMEPKSTLSCKEALPGVAPPQASSSDTFALAALSDEASRKVASTDILVTSAVASFAVENPASASITHQPHEVTSASVKCEEKATDNFKSAPGNSDGSKMGSTCEPFGT